jgi:hypothetical protein
MWYSSKALPSLQGLKSGKIGKVPMPQASRKQAIDLQVIILASYGNKTVLGTSPRQRLLVRPNSLSGAGEGGKDGQSLGRDVR